MSDELQISDKNTDFVPIEIINSLKSPPFSYNAKRDNLFPNHNKKYSELHSKTKNNPKSIHPDFSGLRGDEIQKINPLLEKISVPTIIPSKYRIKKDESKSYLEYEDHEPVSAEEVASKLIVFPTEFPQSRAEVTCLSMTLEKMLEDQARPDHKMDLCSITTEDDIDLMIDLIHQMDEVYRTVLHELARQITTTCEPRGAIVFELRNKYMELISKVPEELLKMKSDVKEQVFKEKRLTIQIEEFQRAIKHLTEQLKDVKIRDIKVTENAERIQSELEIALQDSARSKELLNEYHILYDLQKQRLEKQMTVINSEKEDWSSLTFALSLKISDESLLNTTKRLRLVTKKLCQHSQHFAIFMSDCDTVITSKIQDLSGKCLKQISKIQTETSRTLNNFYDFFHFLKKKLETFRSDSNNQLNSITNCLNSLKSFLAEEALQKILEDISAENILRYDSLLDSINSLLDEWKTQVDKLIHRTPISPPGNDDANRDVDTELLNFSDSFEIIKAWSTEFGTRISLIGGFQPFFHDLNCYIEKIEVKIEEIQSRGDFSETEQNVGPIISLIGDLYLEMFVDREFNDIVKNEDFTEYNKSYNTIQKSLVKFSRTIDLYDAGLMEMINNHQSKITNWIIDAIFLFSKMDFSDDIEKRFQRFSETFESLVFKNDMILQYIAEWTRVFLVSDIPPAEKIELDEYMEENILWSKVAELLIQNISEKIKQELMTRRRKTECEEIGKMSCENIDELIKKIVESTNDKNVFLAIDSVKHLQSEIGSTVSRITTTNEKRALLSSTKEDLQMKIKEMEEKIGVITKEYRELIKTD